MSSTTYLAVAIWDYPSDSLDVQGASHASARFDTLEDAQAFAQNVAGHDPHALLKVYEQLHEYDDEYSDVRDWYFDGTQWDA